MSSKVFRRFGGSPSSQNVIRFSSSPMTTTGRRPPILARPPVLSSTTGNDRPSAVIQTQKIRMDEPAEMNFVLLQVRESLPEERLRTQTGTSRQGAIDFHFTPFIRKNSRSAPFCLFRIAPEHNPV